MLNILSYMAPSIPHELYQYLSSLMEQRLGESTKLWFIETASGPDPSELDVGEDPYSKGLADIGFQCAPTYVWSRDSVPPKVELVGVAPVFSDSRNGGQPIYFSEVVVRADSPHQTLQELRGKTWAYNDPQSLSGYYSILNRLALMGETGDFFSQVRCSGSHLASIELILAGEIEGTAIDSIVWSFWLRDNLGKAKGLKVIDQLGPHGVQPIVMSAFLGEERKAQIREFFAGLSGDPKVMSHLSEHFFLEALVPVDDTHYSREREILRRCADLEFITR